MNEKTIEKKAEKKDTATDDGLAAKIRKMEGELSKLNHFKTHIVEFASKMGFALPSDGKARLGVLISLAVAGLTAAVVMAETVTFPIFDQTTFGNAKFVGDSSTAKTALTVDTETVTTLTATTLTASNATVNGTITQGTTSGPFKNFLLDPYVSTVMVDQDEFSNPRSITKTGDVALGGYVSNTNISGGTLANTAINGELRIAVATNIKWSSISMAYGLDSTVAPFSVSTNSSKKVGYEVRLKLADTNYANHAFVGLMSQASFIAATGIVSGTSELLADNTGSILTNLDYIGFQSILTGASIRTWHFLTGSALEGTYGKGATSNITTATESYVRLGFGFDGTSTLTPYVNGVAGTAITVTTNNAPIDALMTPVFFIKNQTNLAHTVHAPALYVDYWKVMQDR